MACTRRVFGRVRQTPLVDWWEERDRFRRTRPSPQGLRAMGTALGMAGPPVSVRRVGGGLGAATHAVTWPDGRCVILKRYGHGSTTPTAEWAGLTAALGVDLPAPRPLGLDQEGSWFGGPALAMSRLPGRANLRTRSPTAYAGQVAPVLARIHSLAAPPAPSRGPDAAKTHPVDSWTPPDAVPDGVLDRPTVERMLAILEPHLPEARASARRSYKHADFHPGNLLWSRGRLTGVVDWAFAQPGYRAWELSYLRTELALLSSIETADQVYDTYWAAAGLTPEAPDLWDLMCAYNAHGNLHMWLIGYREQGRTDLTLDDLAGRLRPYAERALTRLRGS